jgi:hypothetical protein
MEGLNKDGLLKARPTSFEVWETFTPPKAVNCGVLGSLRKLNTELPPRVWALLLIEKNKSAMNVPDRKAIRS